jgi:antitoxin FitA
MASWCGLGCHPRAANQAVKGSGSVVGGKIDIIAISDYIAGLSTGTSTSMSSITIRNLDPALKERLRVRAAEHGHSMEAEVRRILQSALTGPVRPSGRNLYERIRARVEPLGGIDIELPTREPAREPPRFR